MIGALCANIKTMSLSRLASVRFALEIVRSSRATLRRKTIHLLAADCPELIQTDWSMGCATGAGSEQPYRVRPDCAESAKTAKEK